MAECAGLENRCVRKGTEGSNPSLSAFFTVFCAVNCQCGPLWEFLQFFPFTPETVAVHPFWV